MSDFEWVHDVFKMVYIYQNLPSKFVGSQLRHCNALRGVWLAMESQSMIFDTHGAD